MDSPIIFRYQNITHISHYCGALCFSLLFILLWLFFWIIIWISGFLFHSLKLLRKIPGKQKYPTFGQQTRMVCSGTSGASVFIDSNSILSQIIKNYEKSSYQFSDYDCILTFLWCTQRCIQMYSCVKIGVRIRTLVYAQV